MLRRLQNPYKAPLPFEGSLLYDFRLLAGQGTVLDKDKGTASTLSLPFHAPGDTFLPEDTVQRQSPFIGLTLGCLVLGLC